MDELNLITAHHAHHARQARQAPTVIAVFTTRSQFCNWERRRDLNPRPSCPYYQGVRLNFRRKQDTLST